MPRRQPSRIRIDGDFAYVELTQGKEAIIDVADVIAVADISWHAVRNHTVFYARGYCPVSKRSQGMHQVIMGAKNCDHINRDGLDNRRSNLRYANGSIQKWNQGVRRDCTSGVPGVHLRPDGTWQARVSVEGTRYSLGCFENFADAKRCRESVMKIIEDLTAGGYVAKEELAN